MCTCNLDGRLRNRLGYVGGRRWLQARWRAQAVRERRARRTEAQDEGLEPIDKDVVVELDDIAALGLVREYDIAPDRGAGLSLQAIVINDSLESHIVLVGTANAIQRTDQDLRWEWR